MENIIRCFENLNKEVRHIKILKTLEKHSGIEPGGVIIIVLAALFSSVLFGNWPRLICELQGFVYPAYATIFHSKNYWYTYWILNALMTGLLSMIPSYSLVFAIRFLVTAYISAPVILESQKLHEYFLAKIYTTIVKLFFDQKPLNN